jgi:hypothetical protein
MDLQIDFILKEKGRKGQSLERSVLEISIRANAENDRKGLGLKWWPKRQSPLQA